MFSVLVELDTFRVVGVVLGISVCVAVYRVRTFNRLVMWLMWVLGFVSALLIFGV